MLDTTAYAVLLFSVVKAGQLQITDSQIVNRLTLLHFLVFMSDFVSNWFKNYSIYLAGERKAQVSSSLTELITFIWENRCGRILTLFLSECFFLYEFMDLHLQSFLAIAWLAPLKEATDEGETQLTDLKDIHDLMEFHGVHEVLTKYLKTVLALVMAYRVIVALT